MFRWFDRFLGHVHCRSLWQKLLTVNKTVAAAVLHVKEGEQTVQKINELVEQTTVVPEQFP